MGFFIFICMQSVIISSIISTSRAAQSRDDKLKSLPKGFRCVLIESLTSFHYGAFTVDLNNVVQYVGNTTLIQFIFTTVPIPKQLAFCKTTPLMKLIELAWAIY